MEKYTNFEISTKSICILIISIQIALISLITLDYMGIIIPLLTQIIGFIYLSFVPGFLIIKVLKINKLDLIDTIGYSFGLSLSLVMILGLLINLVYPLVGINNPISLIPLIITFSGLTGILLIFFYRIYANKSFSIKFRNFYQNKKIILSLLILLPIISIIGTYLINLNISNILLVLLFPLISIIMLILVFKNNPTEIYPLAILSISISLLFQRSLISNYLTGYDIQSEYYFASLVVKNSYFNLNIEGTLNAMLSVTMINPIYSIILNMNEIWVFKVVYPLFFSILPLYLYNIYCKVISTDNKKIALFSAILFISFYAFFTEMLGLARQQIAMLYMVLITGIILTRKKSYKNSLLAIIFLLSLVISHYTTAYLYLFFLILFMAPYLLKKKSKVETTFIILFFVMIYTWYAYTSQSAALEGALNFIGNMFSSISNEFFSIGARDPGVGYVVGQIPNISFQRKSFAVLQYIIQFFIAVGIFKTIFRKESFILKKDYLIFVYGSFFLLLLCIVVPMLSTINISRIYLYCLMFLAPIGIIGGIFLIQFISSKILNKFSTQRALKIMVILVIIPYFLLNTGFIYYVTNDPPSSISLDNNMDYAKYSDGEVYATNWLVENRNNNSVIYGDVYGGLIFIGYAQDSIGSLSNGSMWNKNTFMFLREYNINENKLYIAKRNKEGLLSNEYINLTSISFPETNKIYDGKSAILNYNGETAIINF